MKPPLRIKSVSTKVSEEEFAALEARARARKLTLSEWVKLWGTTWPKDPATGKNQDCCHIVPKADGGAHNVNNVEPLPHAEHVKQHKERGDFKRWGKRGGKKPTPPKPEPPKPDPPKPEPPPQPEPPKPSGS